MDYWGGNLCRIEVYRDIGKMKFIKIFWITITILAFLAVMDVYYGKALWDAGNDYRNLYWTFAYAIVIFGALIYYFQTKDKSETASFIAGFFIMLQFGLADVFYYWVQFKPVERGALWWLDVHPVMLHIANFMGFEHVTSLTLYVSASIGVLISYYLIKYLKEKL